MGLKIEDKKLGKALCSSIIQQCYPGIRLSFSVKICDKNQNKIYDQGRFLITFSRRVSRGVWGRAYACRWSKSNFKTNFLTYRIGSSWHQDIFESGMLGTDFVSCISAMLSPFISMDIISKHCYPVKKWKVYEV